MGRRKLINVEDAFPKGDAVKSMMGEYDPVFSRCPSGHVLPYRSVHGRCTPAECVGSSRSQPTEEEGDERLLPFAKRMELFPTGLEAMAALEEVRTPAHAAVVQAQAEEALELARAEGIRSAREAFHLYPELPGPPSGKGLSPIQYVEKRLEDVSPYLLEAEIFDALYGAPNVRKEMRDRLLDRWGGAPKRRDRGTDNARGPVLIVNIGDKTPYDAQTKRVIVEGGLPRGLPEGSDE